MAHASESAATAAANQRAERLKAAGVAGLTLVDAVEFGTQGAEHWRLANGLQAIIAADKLASAVAVHVWVKTGSADEVAGKSGMAHLLEHLMFKGSKNVPAGAFDRELEAHGASSNAATWFDWTMFHQTVPPVLVPRVLQMEADRLTGLKLTAAAVKSELQVVRNERREVVDSDPDGMVNELLAQALYGNSPYAHPIVGTAADLDAVQQKDVADFYKAHYGPGSAAVVVAGGVDPDVALTEIVKYFGPLPATIPPKRPDAGAKMAALAGEVRKALVIDAESSRAVVAWPTVAASDADHAALAGLCEALCGGEGSRLPRRMIDELQIATSAACYQDDMRLQGSLTVSVTLRPGRTAAEGLAAVDALVAELLGAAPLQDREWTLARNRMTTSHFRALTTANGRADVLGTHWASAGGLGAMGAWWQRIGQLQASDLQAAAKKYLGSKKRAIVLADPAGPKAARGGRAQRAAAKAAE